MYAEVLDGQGDPVATGMSDGGRAAVTEAGEVDPVEVAVLDLPEPVGRGRVVRAAAE